MDLEYLIKNMVREMFPLLEKKVLIFLSGGSVNTDILFRVLADLKYRHYSLVISDSGKSLLNKEAIQKLDGKIIESIFELEESVTKADLILIPVMTRNTLSKVALGIADNLVTTGIAKAIMMNKEILAIKDSFDANHPINKVNNLANNYTYNSMLTNYEDQLTNFGVKFIELEEFKNVVQQKITHTFIQEKKEISTENEVDQKEIKVQSSVVTLTDIRGYANNVVIKIKPNTIVTPLARDFIASNSMKLEFIHE